MRRISTLGLALAATVLATAVPSAQAIGLPLPVVTLVSTVSSAVPIVSTATSGAAGSKLVPSCGPTAPVFTPWRDPSDYYFARNGGFESGAANWTLSGPGSVVAGNEPFGLARDRGTHALELGPRGVAAISTCYGLTYPAVRFVAAAVGGHPLVHVHVSAYGPLGLLSTLDGGTFAASRSWQPSPKFSTLFSALTSPVSASSMTVQVTVTNGTALIDDLYVDPFLTKS
jgi:hypothetical protein